MTFYVVLLVMVAGFLALRLYSVLGKRTGHEQPLPKPAEKRVMAPVLPRSTETAQEPREPANRDIEAGAEAGLRSIVATDSSFDVPQFLSGARAAYGMVLEAYWKGDRDQLGWLCEDHVGDAFISAIEAREAAGQRLENRLISVDRATITDAALVGKQARVSVRFDAVIAGVTRDADGEVIAGSTTDAVEAHDIWTFARTLKSGDPNWKLFDTDEA